MDYLQFENSTVSFLLKDRDPNEPWSQWYQHIIGQKFGVTNLGLSLNIFAVDVNLSLKIFRYENLNLKYEVS